MKITGFQLGAFTVAVIGVVILAIFDKPTGSFIALVTPILTAIYLDAKAERQSRVLENQNEVLENQNQQLAQITHQTNGELDRRIRAAVDEAAAKAAAVAAEAAARREP
ncbi:hypothetical protein ACFUJU_07865 [Streptomyces sp. NPDC057235]|uniref:hypothetical protein n=1 Tax=Streptomyces sp. NPDC057235 TaxID=3346058 RepID=UPI003636206B